MATKNKYLVGLIFCFLAFVGSCAKFCKSTHSIVNVIILFVILVLILVVAGFCFIKYRELASIDLYAERKAKISDLEDQYNLFLFVVDSIIETDVKNLLYEINEPGRPIMKATVHKHNYLITFEQILNDVSQQSAFVEPDEFLTASCLMYSLLSDLTVKVKDSHTKRISLSNKLKATIAFDCALEVVLNTANVTNGISLEQIKDMPIYDNIVCTLIKDYCVSGIMYVSQFANLLYLLVCQN